MPSDAMEQMNLLVAANAGDIQAFAEFYDEYATGLLGWFRRRTAASDIAGELTAETFAEALACLDRYDAQRGAPGAWLYGIARNQLRQWLRSERVRDTARATFNVEVASLHVDEFVMAEFRADLERVVGELDSALAALSEPLRQAVEARVIEELDYAVIAARLGCSEGAARVRVSRGLMRLQEHLATAGITDV